MKKTISLVGVLAVILLAGTFHSWADEGLSNSSTIQPTPKPTAVSPAVKTGKGKRAKRKLPTLPSAQQDGSSFEKAVVIQATSEGTGEDEEYAWIARHYPGYKTDHQALTENNNKPYDIISIVTKDGKKLDLIFDISNFYGKF